MAELRTGDTFVDVGAFIGLHTIAVGLRLRGLGQVIAFEPDSTNCSLLREHIKLNGLEGKVDLHQAAVSDKDGHSPFLADGSSEARLVLPGRSDATVIDVVTLDGALVGKRVDILKIDVEGYEEMVLRGATKLLRAPELKPRAIFIEVHPYAWASLNTTSDSLLGLLNETGYQVQTMDGVSINSIERYSEIVARV
jgi:FkbM family methyltransferase